MSMSVGGFYGARNKRKWSGIERSLDNAVKRHREDKIPKAFKSRILGPSMKWETFYRQQDAFSYARSTAKDLHVFAFESETLVGDSGQRMYLVASYPVFWHYYSQLHEDKRHHYEIIPEGAVCKLYFDLEYNVSTNPDRKGDQMVETLIKYVCLCLKKEFKVQVGREEILDLQASIDAKFSRHLIFLLKNVAFRNNVHAGKFVCHIMSQLLEFVKHGREKDAKASSNTDTMTIDSLIADKESIDDSSNDNSHTPKLTNNKVGVSIGNIEENLSTSNSKDENKAAEERILVENGIGSVHENLDLCSSDEMRTSTNACKEANIQDKVSDSRNEAIDHDQRSDTEIENTNSVADSKPKTCNVNMAKESKPQKNKVKMPDFSEVLSEFSNEDLLSMIVQNKNGDETLFCDTGVYTKNRNFRLFMSSKLGKKNPLTVSNQNQYKSDKGNNSDEQMFYDSLVANVQYCEKMKILSYDHDSPESLRIGSTCRSSQERNTSTIEGYNKSPYPEVDDFVIDRITQNGARGVIRHWTYFQHGELLVYEIARYRFCHNIGREHRSNNIMYIADLRRGIYYQKCHDPDCQIQSFKSQDRPLPKEILPAHYFDELSDDMDFEVEDEDFLNTTAEMERQYYLNQSRESGGEDLSLTLEDGDDEELLSALDQIETKQDS